MMEVDNTSYKVKRDVSIVWTLYLACVSLTLVFAASYAEDADSMMPVRDTTYGKIRGYRYKLKSGREVERYLGVPYAAPPVGDRRFELPTPPARWQEVLPTIRLSPACMQALLDQAYIRDHNPNFDGVMSEDCLYLNVYLPRRQESTPTLLPVLIHVHGGSNEVGMGAMFHGDVLASVGDMVVVTFNYRLGAFGFLTVPQMEIVGNFGLHDQVMAFRWVKDNIATFGGDPTKVTIQGHSAGSTDVGIHVLSPVSKGLFRHAILMSGSPTAYWALHPHIDPEDRTQGPTNHLLNLGCYKEQREATLACLRRLNATSISSTEYHHGRGRFTFSPTVDNELIVDNPEAFLTRMSQTEGSKLDVGSIMIGVVKDEGSLTADILLKNQMEKEKSGRYLTVQEMNEKDHVEVPERFDDQMFRKFSTPDLASFRQVANVDELSYYVYKPWRDPTNSTANTIALSDLAGDVTFTAPSILLADLISALNYTDLYVYKFAHRSSLSTYPQWMGVPHGEDLFYLFGSPVEGHPVRNYTSLDKVVSLALIDIWASFVSSGQPSYQGSSSPKPYGDEQNYFQISSNETDVVIHKGMRMRAPFMAYWNQLIPFLSKSPRRDFTVSYTDEGTNVWILTALLCSSIPVCLIVIACLTCYIKRKATRPIGQTSTEETGNML